MEITKYIDLITKFAIEYGLRIVGAIIVLFVGLWIVKRLNKSIYRFLIKRKIDESLQPFLQSLLSALLKVLLVITVMSMVGIEMTSFVAILGAAGLAVGLALSGTLQNFAGGVMVLVLRPYKVGDYIEAQGYTGTVKEIQIFSTILVTVDNKRVILPNAGISTSSLINYTAEETRRVDRVFGISYNDDVERAKKIMLETIQSHDKVLNDPPIFIRLVELGDSSVNITTRSWVKTEDYWDVYFDINESVYDALNKAGISIPYPQMDVHLQKQD
jgi:small conductance mechanosensitive channel